MVCKNGVINPKNTPENTKKIREREDYFDFDCLVLHL